MLSVASQSLLGVSWEELGYYALMSGGCPSVAFQFSVPDDRALCGG